MPMKKPILFLAGVLLAVLMVGCGSEPVLPDPQRDNTDIAAEDNNDAQEPVTSGNTEDGVFERLETRASDVLPEPWMAYPGSMMEIDWQSPPWNTEYPAWLLVAPRGTTREAVVDYYVGKAEERDDFETVSTYHGIGGTWKWKGIEFTVETDGHYEDMELVQFNLVFEQHIN